MPPIAARQNTHLRGAAKRKDTLPIHNANLMAGREAQASPVPPISFAAKILCGM